jgi:hypothetical protein
VRKKYSLAFLMVLLAGAQFAYADTIAISEGMKATVGRKEPCFRDSWQVDSYWDAMAKGDAETLRSFTDGGTSPPIWLRPGQRVRFLDGGGPFSTPRLVVESGVNSGEDCYVRDRPPSNVWAVSK